MMMASFGTRGFGLDLAMSCFVPNTKDGHTNDNRSFEYAYESGTKVCIT